MARWHLTSSAGLHSQASNICEVAELNASGFQSEQNYFIRSYEKRAISNVNFIEFEDNNWVCVAGTLIRDGQIGGKVLTRLYQGFLSAGIDGARSQVLGHYAVAIKHENQITVFTDEQGLFNVYYAKQGENYIISTSLHVVAGCLECRNLDHMELLADVLQISTPGEDTFYSGVKRLFGSQALEIGVLDGELSIRRLPQTMFELSGGETATITEAVSLYRSRVRTVFDHLHGLDPIALNTTGGLDSRTILAALLDRGISPLLIYGVGNSKLTNTKTADLDAAQALASEFSLSFYRMDWSGNQPHSEEKLKILFEKYGFLASTLGASDSFLNELDGGISPYPLLQLGGFTPAFTNMKVWESPLKHYSFSDLIDHYISPFAKHLPQKVSRDYRDRLEASVRSGLSNSPVEFTDESASLKSFVQARLFLYLRPEAKVLNFCNEFSYYLAPFMMKSLYDPLLTIPPEYRRGDQFQIRLTHSLCSRAFEVSVFSGTTPQKIDLRSFTMSPRFRRRLDSFAFVPKSLARAVPERLKVILRGAKADRNKDATINQLILRDSTYHVLNHPIASDLVPDVAALDIRSLDRFRFYLFGIDVMGTD